MMPMQVTLLKQEKVACLIDNDAHLALDSSDPFVIQVMLNCEHMTAALCLMLVTNASRYGISAVCTIC